MREREGKTLVIVGTGKNVGKTVAMRSIYDAAVSAGIMPGLTSIGRDGEAIDVGDAGSKPRLFLLPDTVVATASSVLPVTPASEMLALSSLQTAAGRLIYARVKTPAYYELVGPPSASGVSEAVATLRRHVPFVIVDGAIDRIAALSGTGDAIVVACGASASGTMEQAIDDARALVTRLTIPRYTGGEAVHITGALTPTVVAELIRAKESRTIVVRDATQVILNGRSALAALEALTVRCERALNVVAVTVASIGRERSFEPRTFAREVAAATGLPTFDVYAAERAA